MFLHIQVAVCLSSVMRSGIADAIREDSKITWQRPTVDSPWLDLAVSAARLEQYEDACEHAESPSPCCTFRHVMVCKDDNNLGFGRTGSCGNFGVQKRDSEATRAYSICIYTPGADEPACIQFCFWDAFPPTEIKEHMPPRITKPSKPVSDC